MMAPVPNPRKAISTDDKNCSTASPRTQGRWLRAALYTLFLLVGQSAATLLGRLYYAKGGQSKWLETLVQVGGFPILLPLYYFFQPKSTNTTPNETHTNPPSNFLIASVYVALGLLIAAICMLFSAGLQYLPVSTFSLISATQLVFTAVFSFLLNSQKFTPFTINSLFLLIISSTLLLLQSNEATDGTAKASKGKYVIGFLCTLGGAAGSALLLVLIQWSFHRVLKRKDFRVALHMMVLPSVAASCAASLGLFVSGEWSGLRAEMERFELAKWSYAMILAWTAVCWQVFSVGATGLIFEVSSLFCNVISTVGLPIIPIFAAMFFHEKMNGPKVVSMLLAIWGFVSYAYQQYLDDANSKAEAENQNQVSQALQHQK